eukprot:SAG31_NODE_564_length_14059_cov_5.728940_4_plen_52_part_00
MYMAALAPPSFRDILEALPLPTALPREFRQLERRLRRQVNFLGANTNSFTI